MSFGQPLIHYMVCDSTNESARELAATGFPSGTVVTADDQRQGKGRKGRKWVSKPGTTLLYSAILRPLEPRHALLPLAVPIAVAEAAESLASVSCQLKWPNDVWIDGLKCAGILIEARPEDGWAVIGVGLNVSTEKKDFPAALRKTATSLGSKVEVTDARDALNERLGHWIEADESEVLAAFEERDALRGREISWGEGEGTAEGIDEKGNLLVKTADGEQVSLGAGEVQLAPINGAGPEP
jgi:BirA family transcriptional regulator, biotin operon repressor / biotin---[acetyl-CoA-carboxylase] ligase